MRRLFPYITTLFILSAIVAFTVVPQAAAYNVFGGSGSGNGSATAICNQAAAKTSSLCTTTTADPITGSTGIIHKVVIILSTISGAVAIIMMVIGGFLYVLSNGDSGKIKTARETIIYAAVGLAVIAFSQTIIIFVIDRIK